MSGLDVDVMRARYDQLGRELDQLERERDAAIYEREVAEAAIERVRVVHRPIDYEGYPAAPDGSVSVCSGDGFIWPCPTARALDGEEP